MRNVLAAVAVAGVLGAGAIVLESWRGAGSVADAGVWRGQSARIRDRSIPRRTSRRFALTPPEIPPATGTTPLDRALEQALVADRKGDYAAAATALDGLLIDHPDEPRARSIWASRVCSWTSRRMRSRCCAPLPQRSDPDVAGRGRVVFAGRHRRLRDPSRSRPRPTHCAPSLAADRSARLRCPGGAGERPTARKTGQAVDLRQASARAVPVLRLLCAICGLSVAPAILLG